jgi:hypothetical protein
MTAASPAVADHPLRPARRRRGLTLVVLAGMSGLSVPFLSMAENGQRTLSMRDHASALAAALRVRPAEIAPSVIPGFGQWAPAPPVPASAFPPPVPASAFPPVGDGIAVARHRRMARNPGVSTRLLLDQLTAPDTCLSGLRSRPLGGSEARLVSAGRAGRGRAG